MSIENGGNMEKLDYKKVYKDLYCPKEEPMLVDVPNMKFIMVYGKGNPNEENGEYKEALQLLYGLSFTIKMSKMGKEKIKGYFEYVVPPLEGFWWQEGSKKIKYIDKENFQWISMIRQPEFVTEEVFESACNQLYQKKGIDISKAKWKELEEGLCVQMMHVGSYDYETETIRKIDEYIKNNHLRNDIGATLEDDFIRRHHEIYLSDPRRVKESNLKTVIRIPVRGEEE